MYATIRVTNWYADFIRTFDFFIATIAPKYPPANEPRRSIGSIKISIEDIRYRTATVVSIGTHVEGVKNGDNIYYDRVAGHNIEIDNNIFKVIQEQDVIIVL